MVNYNLSVLHGYEKRETSFFSVKAVTS